MLRQILIEPLDRRFVTILRPEHPALELKHYVLFTVTYGTACAPFLAVRCLHQLAIENADKFPIASSCIKEVFYMDDLVSGALSVKAALILREQLTSVLQSGAFK